MQNIKPDRFCVRWDKTEEQQLLDELENNRTIKEIGVIHKRTYGGINSRISILVYRMHALNNIPIKEIENKTLLTEENINERIDRIIYTMHKWRNISIKEIENNTMLTEEDINKRIARITERREKGTIHKEKKEIPERDNNTTSNIRITRITKRREKGTIHKEKKEIPERDNNTTINKIKELYSGIDLMPSLIMGVLKLKYVSIHGRDIEVTSSNVEQLSLDNFNAVFRLIALYNRHPSSGNTIAGPAPAKNIINISINTENHSYSNHIVKRLYITYIYTERILLEKKIESVLEEFLLEEFLLEGFVKNINKDSFQQYESYILPNIVNKLENLSLMLSK